MPSNEPINGQCPYNPRVQDSDIPARMARRPVDARGYPVPFFVDYINGVPDFRAVAHAKLAKCHNKKLCWCCGEPLGRNIAFVIGPMCMVNRISSEPPAHLECAEFAARVCPFMANAKARRRESDLPEHVEPGGLMLKHNPGVYIIWVTRSYRLVHVDNGVLFNIGEPENVGFYSEGRKATLKEVLPALQMGKEKLALAAGVDDPQDIADLEAQTSKTIRFVENHFIERENENV